MTQRREKQPWRGKGEQGYGEESGEGAAGEKLLVGDVDGRRETTNEERDTNIYSERRTKTQHERKPFG